MARHLSGALHGGVPIPSPMSSSRCPHGVSDATRPRDSEGGQIPEPRVLGPGRAAATGALEPAGLSAEGGAPDAAAHGQPGHPAGEGAPRGTMGHQGVPGIHPHPCPPNSSHQPSQSMPGPTCAWRTVPWAQRRHGWMSAWSRRSGTPGPPRSPHHLLSPWWLGTLPHCTAWPEVWGAWRTVVEKGCLERYLTPQ